MKLAKVIERVTEHVVKARGPEGAGDREIVDMVLWTIREVGLCVAPDGEIYNPAPRDEWKPPEQIGVHHASSGSRLRAKGARGR